MFYIYWYHTLLCINLYIQLFISRKSCIFSNQQNFAQNVLELHKNSWFNLSSVSNSEFVLHLGQRLIPLCHRKSKIGKAVSPAWVPRSSLFDRNAEGKTVLPDSPQC